MSTLFDGLIEKKRIAINKQKDDLLKFLEMTPDFYLEMKWDFESSIIPFVSKLAPSGKLLRWDINLYSRHLQDLEVQTISSTRLHIHGLQEV